MGFLSPLCPVACGLLARARVLVLLGFAWPSPAGPCTYAFHVGRTKDGGSCFHNRFALSLVPFSSLPFTAQTELTPHRSCTAHGTHTMHHHHPPATATQQGRTGGGRCSLGHTRERGGMRTARIQFRFAFWCARPLAPTFTQGPCSHAPSASTPAPPTHRSRCAAGGAATSWLRAGIAARTAWWAAHAARALPACEL